MQRLGESENTISPKTPTPHNQPMEGRKDKTVGDKKETANHANRKALALTIIIIIKIGWQCKAEREWYTPYQSEDPSPTIPTYRQKEEKGKKSIRL